jgi:hypothetical protein
MNLPTETLEWVRYDEERGELVIQLEKGGAACALKRGMKMETVVNELRTLCNRLAGGVHQRALPTINESASFKRKRWTGDFL